MGIDKLITEFMQMLNMNAGGIMLFIIFLMSIIQVAPIKINPWSWIANKISSGIIGTMAESMEKVEDDISTLKEDLNMVKKNISSMNDEITNLKDNIEEQAAITARVRILRMNDEILRGTKHTKENLDQCLNDITVYDTYCNEHPKFRNNMTVLSSENIKSVYRECMKNHSFLSYSVSIDDIGRNGNED